MYRTYSERRRFARSPLGGNVTNSYLFLSMRQARNGEMSARATATAAPRSVRRSARGSPLAYLYVVRTHGDLAFLERTFMGASSSSWVLAVVLAAAIMTALMTEPGCSVLIAGYSPRAWGSNQAAAAGSPRLLQIVDVGSARFRA